jgi:hypothetical protein
MASSSDIILRVRRRIHDADFDGEDRPLYNNDVYLDALNRGLMRVNLILSKNYTVDTVPTKVEYLVELRTTIEMCHVRGAEGATGDVSDNPDLAIQTLTLPAGFTQSTSQMSYEGARFWRNLSERLEREFQEIVDEVQNALDPTLGAIHVGVIQRKSLRTGRATSYHYDRALPAPDISVAKSGSNVVIQWEPILSEFLETYALERSTDVDFTNYEQVYSTYDNQAKMYLDLNLAQGHYYYRLKVVNTNDLYEYSPTAHIHIN